MRRLRLSANWHKHSEPDGSGPLMLTTWDDFLACARKKTLTFLPVLLYDHIWVILVKRLVSANLRLRKKARVCKLKEQYVNMQGHSLISPCTPTKGWDQPCLLIWSVYLSCSKWKADRSAVTSLCVSPDGKLLLSAGQVIKMWDLDTKEVYRVSLSRLFLLEVIFFFFFV